MRYDCVIVGGGPAGSTAARILAGSGLSVVVLEKDRFPRVKPCGGGLTTRSFQEMGLDLAGHVQHEARTVRVITGPGRITELEARGTLARVVDRARLDHFLLEEARRAGAAVFQRTKVGAVERSAEGFVVLTGSGTYRTPFLIGADGANSIVNRSLRIVERTEFGKGMVVILPGDRYQGDPRLTFDFSAVPLGYAWIFPRRDSLCAGVYTLDRRLEGLSAHLDRFLLKEGYTDHGDIERWAHILPFWGIRYRQPAFPAILTGDAAGFVDPMSGEGISYAVTSAGIAARAVLEAFQSRSFDPAALQERYHREVIRILRVGRRLSRIFYGRKPPLSRIVTSELALRIFSLAFLRGDGYPDIAKRLPGYLAASVLARVLKS
ncbi:MAG: NAD(P)/FAD-dependent oxidoreductase [bacterium]|nr:MAG: NAD(P)/FAD-dependent oxidoreductase [bacterium]